MGVGKVGCCDNNTSLKNSEVSVQSVTYRERIEDYSFSANLISNPSSINELQNYDMIERINDLKKLEKYMTLVIKIISPQANGVVEIKPTGLVNSRRQFSDGYVFFGSNYYLDDNVVNDYRLVFEDSNKYNTLGRFFMIYYNLDTSSYWVRDLYAGPGLFIRLDFPLVIKDKTIVNIGNSFLQFSFKSKAALNPDLEVSRLGDENYKL